MYIALMLVWIATMLIGLAASGYQIYQIAQPHIEAWQRSRGRAAAAANREAPAADDLETDEAAEVEAADDVEEPDDEDQADVLRSRANESDDSEFDDLDLPDDFETQADDEEEKAR